MRKTFYGAKQLNAEPMTLGAYNTFRGWKIPKDEDATREGYLVEYQDGYISWSPKEVFESAYREITALSYSQALEAIKAGHRVSRAGWNGKGMFIELNKGLLPGNTHDDVPEIEYENVTSDDAGKISHVDNIPVALFDYVEGGNCVMVPNIDMWTATGSWVRGWQASQTDMMADDWGIIEGE